MTTGGLLAFLGVSLLVIFTPGQDMALVLRNTLGGGHKAGLYTSLGVVMGLIVWATATSLGLVALLQSSQVLFDALKFAGALYLAYLGLQALRALFRSLPSMTIESELDRPPSMRGRVALRQGLVSNLGNPKIALFFSSLLPQFLDPSAGSFLPVLVLGMIFCLITLCWLLTYATLLDRASVFMRRPRVRKTIEAVTGVVLIGLALRLATERR
jgi:threonine/homoserine/homoserine lactone efflux protein